MFRMETEEHKEEQLNLGDSGALKRALDEAVIEVRFKAKQSRSCGSATTGLRMGRLSCGRVWQAAELLHDAGRLGRHAE